MKEEMDEQTRKDKKKKMMRKGTEYSDNEEMNFLKK